MKKSPLSTPSSSAAKHGYACKSPEEFSGIGYGQVRVQNCYYKPKNASPRTLRDDFIPLNLNASQNEQDGHTGDRHGSGSQRCYQNPNSWISCTNGQYQNSNLRNSYSPYKQSVNTFRGRNKKGQKEIRKRTSISSYVNLRSFLEDPWAELIQKMEEPEQKAAVESQTARAFGTRADQIDPQQNVYNNASAENLDDSGLSQESRNDTFDESLDSNDQNASQVSKADSSVDLKFDEMKFAHDTNLDVSPRSGGYIKSTYICRNGRNVAADAEEKCK